MITLYRPVLIESAEQAEALPIGTVADDGGLKAMKAWDLWRMVWPPGAKASPRLSVVGWTALVPIEAEEETRISETRSRWRGFKESRLVTPWEEA